ncbi:hypothetical protein TNCV_2003571 [Trichonephila clavipes]|nr:hypothetical protein TNCV_2003571 [Trichonephila clavipes]
MTSQGGPLRLEEKPRESFRQNASCRCHNSPAPEFAIKIPESGKTGENTTLRIGMATLPFFLEGNNKYGAGGNSERFTEEVQPLASIVQFTGNSFDIPFHPQWSCLVSPYPLTNLRSFAVLP